jgi:hypothetical protein
MGLQESNSWHFLLREGAAPEFCPMRTEHSPSLIASGELHGRKLASAIMRSCVHNRTCDRGGKPTWLARGVGIAPGPSGGAGGVGFRKIRLFRPCPACVLCPSLRSAFAATAHHYSSVLVWACTREKRPALSSATLPIAIACALDGTTLAR